MDEMKEELVKDGYIEETEEEFEMEFDEDRIIINGERLPDSLHEKYMKIYEQHFDKKLEKRIQIK